MNTRSCARYSRPVTPYGYREEATDWIGWSRACNWHWYHPMAKELSAYLLLQNFSPEVAASIWSS